MRKVDASRGTVDRKGCRAEARAPRDAGGEVFRVEGPSWRARAPAAVRSRWPSQTASQPRRTPPRSGPVSPARAPGLPGPQRAHNHRRAPTLPIDAFACLHSRADALSLADPAGPADTKVWTIGAVSASGEALYR